MEIKTLGIQNVWIRLVKFLISYPTYLSSNWEYQTRQDNNIPYKGLFMLQFSTYNFASNKI